VDANELMENKQHPVDDKTWQGYRDALYRFILRRVDNAAIAEDIVQDVLVKAYIQRETLKEPSKLKPWLYQITRNAITDHYRRHKPMESLPQELPQETGEEEDRGKQELAQCMAPLLDTLPDTYRQALKLSELEGVKQQEVASRLDISLSGAKSRVQRGRRMLRDALLQCCRVELDHRGNAVDFEDGGICDCC